MNDVKILIKKILRPIWYKIKDITYIIAFLWYRHYGNKPRIMSCDETIEYIIKHKCSVARFGDGEYVLMMNNEKIGFQDPSYELKNDLWESIKKDIPNLLICIQTGDDNYQWGTYDRKFEEWFYFTHYRHFIKLIDHKYNYGDAKITRFYNPSQSKYTDFDELEKYVNRIKGIWENKNIIFVEGISTKLGVGNDLFNNAKTIRRILCPAKNAYAVKDKIYQSIIKHATNDDLILLALGPTASILAADIASKTDLWAIDIGHVDVVYLWMKNKCSYKMNIEGKHVNEANDDADIIKINYDEATYRSQIIDKVS